MNRDYPDEFEDFEALEDDISNTSDADVLIAIERTYAVRVYLIAAFLSGVFLLLGTIVVIGGRAKVNPQLMMPCILGTFLAGLCAVAYFWIRARYVCVAVLDENGVLARTFERRYDLAWEDIIGVRTKITYPKDGGVPKVRMLILLEDERCLELPIGFDDYSKLSKLKYAAALKKGAEGQRLGTLKSSLLFVFGVIGVALSLWWNLILFEQLNRGVLFQGNIKGVGIKIGLGIAGPIAGIASTIGGLYHIIARPILYAPGWIETQSYQS